MTTIRIGYDDLHATLRQALERAGMQRERADRSARMFAGATLDGVASHGVARFPRFMAMIASGCVDVSAAAERVASHAALERWDGRRGPGNLNASDCMAAAVGLARAHGIGCVALANTNHWMRGGTYGWQAAEAGAMAICWTNTLPNLPPWGAREPRVGNNPLVIAVPHPPAHVVLDMAMSQFSFGSLASYRARGETLPVAGGYDAGGSLTRDPAAIEDGGRMAPIGFWKGSGLALVLDLLAALLSHGQPTWRIGADPERETGLSQAFIAIDAAVAGDRSAAAALVDDVLRQVKGADGDAVRYPGERALAARRRNLAEGIPVEEELWREIASLSGARS